MGSKGAEPPSHTNCLTYGPSRRSAYGPPRRSAHGVKGCTTHNSQPFPAPTVRPRTQPTIRSRTLSHAQKSAKDTQKSAKDTQKSAKDTQKSAKDTQTITTVRPRTQPTIRSRTLSHALRGDSMDTQMYPAPHGHLQQQATQQLNHRLPSHVCFQAPRFSHHIFFPLASILPRTSHITIHDQYC